MAVEAAFVRPESIDVVKASLLYALKGNLQTGERVQRRRRREQVRQRSVGRRPEAALGMTSREQPIANGIIYWDRQIPQQSHRRRGGIGGTCLYAPFIGPSAIVGFEEFQGLHEAKRVGQSALQILVRTESQKAAIHSTKSGTGRRMITTVLGSESLDVP